MQHENDVIMGKMMLVLKTLVKKYLLRGLSQKNPTIFNILRTGRLALMNLGSQSEETFLSIREQSLSRAASQLLVGRC
jgi:hypothetical protein